MEDLIEKLILNAKAIYNLYQKLRIAKEKKTEKQEINTLFDYLEICKKNEQKLLDKLLQFYHENLPDILMNYRDIYGIEEMELLENYINCSNGALPILRVFEKLKFLVKNNPIFVPKHYENSDLLFEEEQDEKVFFNEEEFITTEIYDSFHLELIMRFTNLSQKKDICKKKFSEKRKQIPYDMAFLNEFLEDLFIKERIINLSYQLFNTKIQFKKNFSSIMLNKTIVNLSLEMLERYMQEYIAKEVSKSSHAAFIGMIYIHTLLDLLDEDKRDDFVIEYRNEIDDIPYDFPLVRRLKEEASNIYVEEIDIEDLQK